MQNDRLGVEAMTRMRMKPRESKPAAAQMEMQILPWSPCQPSSE